MLKGDNGYIYRGDGDMHAHEFMLYALVRGLKPERILEIGVRTGVSTFAMTNAVIDEGIDCDYHICDIDDMCTQLDFPIPVNYHIMTSNELHDNIWIKTMLPIDLLMIDGCHQYEQVLADWDNFEPFVLKNGFILFHDTYPPTEKHKAPDLCWSAYKVLNDLKQRSDIEVLTMPYSYGLTIVRKL